MTYRAKHVTQVDGTELQYANCRMAVGATHLDHHTQGAKLATGARMRSHQQDMVGGTDADDLRRAWERGYSEQLVIRNGRYWDDLLQDRSQERFIGLDVWYALLPIRCQKSALFGHTIGIAPETRKGLWLVSDPLCSDWGWHDPMDLRVAAEYYGKRILGGGTRRTRGGATSYPVANGKLSLSDLVPGPIFYTTSIGVDAVSGLMIKPVRAVAGVFTYTDPTPNSVKVSDRSYVKAKQGDKRPVVAEVEITDPELFTGQKAYLAAQGDESVVMLASRGRFEADDSGNDVRDILLDSRDADWVAHLTPPRTL